MNRSRLIITQFILLLMVAMVFIVEPALARPNSEKPAATAADSKWDTWFIVSAESTWTVEELDLVHQVLFNTITALEDAGYDGQELLSGYHFRRQYGEFVDGVDGRIALVRHHKHEVILSDSAFLRLQGFYIYHELGHIVDKRLDRNLNQRFHDIAGTAGVENPQQTIDGYWLNEHARMDRQEATADAFALWVVLRYTDNYKPVFWNTPYTVSYEDIVDALDVAI